MREFVEQFMSNFSRPMEPGRELIPTRWRVPFFLGLAVVSLLALVLLTRFVVMPAIRAQQDGATVVRPSDAPR